MKKLEWLRRLRASSLMKKSAKEALPLQEIWNSIFYSADIIWKEMPLLGVFDVEWKSFDYCFGTAGLLGVVTLGALRMMFG